MSDVVKKPNLNRLFVYGTLKRGYVNNRIMGNAEFMGNAALHGYIMMSLGTFPAIFKAPEDDREYVVHGEVFDIDDEALKACDTLEGVDHKFYSREEITVPIWGKAYTYTRPSPIGDWTKVVGGTWNGPDNSGFIHVRKRALDNYTSRFPQIRHDSSPIVTYDTDPLEALNNNLFKPASTNNQEQAANND